MENLRLTDGVFPKDISGDIETIQKILLDYGAARVILYGSMARGDYRADSDIDICVEGLPAKNYFRAYAECMMHSHRSASVIDLANTYGRLRERILTEGRIVAVSIAKLREEIEFGLENLERIYANVVKFSQQDTSQDIVIAALTYECFGYYNVVEHLIIRFLKYLKIEIPTGPFSHRDTLRSFYEATRARGFELAPESVVVMENLMAFRHVATKIYSFLVDWAKLEVIIGDIKDNHTELKQLFVDFLEKMGS